MEFSPVPIVLHVVSIAAHLSIFAAVAYLFLRKQSHGVSKEEVTNERRFLHRNTVILGCLSLGFFHLVLCPFSFSSRDGVAAALDFGTRAVTWFMLSFYLGLVFARSPERKFPAWLRIWWAVFLLMSVFYLVVDLLYYGGVGIFASNRWISDSGSAVFALVLNYAGFVGKRIEEATEEEEENSLREPLLNGGNAVDTDAASPFSRAGFFSILTFSWVTPLLDIGHKKTLDLKDVPQLDHRDSINEVFPVFRRNMDFYTGGASHGITSFQLAKALVFTIWEQIVSTALYALVYTFATYVGPYLINDFVEFLNGTAGLSNKGYVLVAAFMAGKLFECLSQRHWFFRTQQAGVRARSALVAMIYEKGLLLSSSARQSRTSGETINIMSIDADRIGLFSWYMHDLWMTPIQVGLALFILYTRLGLASLATLAATVLVMLTNVPLGKMEEKFQNKMMESKDIRMKATSEILRNMRILKFQAWEMKFLNRIMELRKKEANWLKKYLYAGSFITLVFWSAPTFIAVVTFGTCMLMGIPLESGKVLSALATFGVLQVPIYNLPDTISMIIQTKVSLDRISLFLRLEELQSNVVEKIPCGTSEVAIDVRDATFSWDISSETPTLKDLNFEVVRGMRVAVCGIVGSGKSSLLSCVLGEIPKISGMVKLCGTTAYVAQTAWIQSGKIQDNILFGKEMDRERYEMVLNACSLKKDLEILPFGDKTVIGERGINLSGGQKQRIQIARALYHDADIFLFDDPFSAVDAHTGSHLFKECLLGMLASKTVVYVTHQVEFLPSADLILVMKDGRVAQAGKYEDLLSSGSDFMELVNAHKDALSALETVERDPDTLISATIGDPSCEENNETAQIQEGKKDDQNDHGKESVAKNGQLVQEEEREKGKVGFSVYWRYITTSYKGALVPLILLAQILFQLLQIGSNYWMAWAAPVSKGVEPPVNGSLLISVYVALALGSSICIFVRALLVVTAGYKTSTLLFNIMHMSVFRAPMSFFDSTPSGRILNRASTDQSEVDASIPYQISSFAFSIIQLLGIIAVMSQIAWQVFIIFIPVVAMCVWYQQYYIETARELARLIGVCKAPIIQNFAESMSGTATIRSFNEESRFVQTNFHLSDEYSRPKFYTAAAREWLCFCLDFLSSLTFAISLIFLVCLPAGYINPSIAGLTVTYGLNLNTLQAYVIWNLCNLETKIISVERILQYTSIPSEPPLVIEDARPTSSWPSKGEIILQNLQVRYAPQMPFVLKGLACTFPGGMKTGIVGRTGSGKSTLIQTLFRIIDPTVGTIHIDGIDISTIGLHDLRSRLSIIPQDPTMFEGTIRNNLDPLEEYSDEQIWEALDNCQLGDEVRKKELKIDSIVTENGENWSVGQRQLVCLGRVILKKSRVLVLDEATASVDTATDSLIQKTIRLQFSDSTVITIAHRITSVLDSDIVLLLDEGTLVENDSPARLLEDKSSLFSKLVSEYTMRSGTGFRGH